MSVLYRRVLLWHKMVATVSGGLALCSAKHKLPRDEAERWATLMENVAAEVREVLAGRPFILDERGQRMSDGPTRPASRFFYSKGGSDVIETSRSAEARQTGKPRAASPDQKAGGPRVAKRKNAK